MDPSTRKSLPPPRRQFRDHHTYHGICTVEIDSKFNKSTAYPSWYAKFGNRWEIPLGTINQGLYQNYDLLAAVRLPLQVNILKKIKHTQSSLRGYQPKVGWHRVIVLSQATNKNDIYKWRPTPNTAPTPPSNATKPILVFDQIRSTSSNYEGIVWSIPQDNRSKKKSSGIVMYHYKSYRKS